MKRSPQSFTFVGILFLAFALFLLWKVMPLASKTAREASSEEIQDPNLQPTPFPFQEMTIPSLRSRTYVSEMGEQKKLSSNSSFSSYLTNYTSDGLHINALLTKPTGETPPDGFPAIVFVHGYIPPTLYTTTSRYVDYINFLAKNGFVVFKIDLRGHGDSEGEPGGAYYSEDYVIDTRSAMEALKSLPEVNPNRIGLWGHSMAGNVVSRAIASGADSKASAIWAGAGYTYSDLLTYRINDQSYRPPSTSNPQASRRRLLMEKYGQFDPNNAFWKQIPATNYLSNIKGAIGLFHAVDDSVVNVEYSRNLNTILDTTAIVHELHEYPSGGHNISGSSFTKAMQATVDFYKKNL